MPTIDELVRTLTTYQGSLDERKHRANPDKAFWYPYGALSNVVHLNNLLQGDHRDLSSLIKDRPVLDIGAADGDMAFYLESYGCTGEIVDHAPTNFNGLRGARLLKEVLGSSVEIHDVDLDSQFTLPGVSYGLILFLGILYHLKNPYYVLEELAKRTEWCLVSTRVAGYTPDSRVDISSYPVAYLLDPTECNNDPTNFWIFSHTGLRRLFERTGWEISEYMAAGDTVHSDPAHADRDERAFALLRSRVAEGR